MRAYLLPESGQLYKANLHSHSTCSDGGLSPEQLKAAYKAQGYAILAFSDHEVLFRHNELTDSEFLALNAYEISICDELDEQTPDVFKRIVDLGLIAKRPDQEVQVGFHPKAVEWHVERGILTEAQAAAIPHTGGLRELYYSVDNVNSIIADANEASYLVVLNHPMWSMVSAADYAAMEGAWAVEVYNHGCHIHNGMGDSEAVLDELLRTGKRPFALATDDDHDRHGLGHPDCDAFGGFVMVKCDTLDYPSVIRALELGHFYASTGPHIHELYVEDGYVHLVCDGAAEICVTTLGRRGRTWRADPNELLTAVRFKLDPQKHGFIRFRITDEHGKRAYTNAYDVAPLLEGATPRSKI